MEEPCKESILFSTKNAVATLDAAGYSISTVVQPWPLHGGSGGGLAQYEAALRLSHHGHPTTTDHDTLSSAHFTAPSTSAIPELPPGLIFPQNGTDSVGPLYANLLLTAAAQGHNRLCEALLSAGAPATACNASNWTALHAAAACGNVPLFKTLLAHGGDVTAVTIRGCTVLHAAIRGAARQPDVNLLAICSAILCALAEEDDRLGSATSDSLLLDYVNAQDDDGKTPLHLAVESFNAIGSPTKNDDLLSVIDLLTASPCFADPTIEDDDGRSPFALAATNKRAPSVCALLLRSPLDHALFSTLCV